MSLHIHLFNRWNVLLREWQCVCGETTASYSPDSHQRRGDEHPQPSPAAPPSKPKAKKQKALR